MVLHLQPNVASEGSTILQGRHHFEQAPRVPRAENLIEDLWKPACSNLDAHLKGSEGLLRPDFTDPSPCVRLSIVIDAPRETVFSAARSRHAQSLGFLGGGRGPRGGRYSIRLAIQGRRSRRGGRADQDPRAGGERKTGYRLARLARRSRHAANDDRVVARSVGARRA